MSTFGLIIYALNAKYEWDEEGITMAVFMALVVSAAVPVWIGVVQYDAVVDAREHVWLEYVDENDCTQLYWDHSTTEVYECVDTYAVVDTTTYDWVSFNGTGVVS